MIHLVQAKLLQVVPLFLLVNHHQVVAKHLAVLPLAPQVAVLQVLLIVLLPVLAVVLQVPQTVAQVVPLVHQVVNLLPVVQVAALAVLLQAL